MLWGLRVLFVAPVDVPTGAMFFVLAMTLPLSAIMPTAAATLNLLLLTVSSFLGEVPNILVLSSIFIVVVIVVQRHFGTAAVFATLTTVLGFYSHEEREFNFDVSALLLFTIMMVTAFAAGRWIDVWQTREKQRKLQEKQRQEELTNLLHDTVAAGLTSLIVRLEALAISTPEKRLAIEQCAATARKSMLDTQYLISELNTALGGAPPFNIYSPAELVEQAISVLRAHGYQVEADNQLDAVRVCDSITKALNQTLSEATANIIKYATPTSRVTIRAKATENEMVILLANTFSSGTQQSRSSRLGLRSMKRTIGALGGEVEIKQSAPHWSVCLTIPN